jgi:DNA invertase Pin-like site-specific DNA recombinase
MYAIYCRVSTEDQAKKGYSLPDQLRSCQDKLNAMGIYDIREYVEDEGASGEFLDRPALNQLRDDMQNKLVKGVMIYDPDRFSRSLNVQLLVADEIEKTHKLPLHFVTGDFDASPEGRLFFVMRGAISEYEKNKIRERTVRGKRSKANAGKIIFNSRPFGYGWDAANSMFIIDEKQAAIMRYARKLLVQDKMGTYRIQKELHSIGVSVCQKTINNWLTKEMYTGDYWQFQQKTKKTGQRTRDVMDNPKEEQVLIKIPAIFTREEFDEAQRQLAANRVTAKRNTQHEYLLQGIVYCAHCGRRMISRHMPGYRKKKPTVHYYYYQCIAVVNSDYRTMGKECTNRTRIPSDTLDYAVWSAFENIASGQATIADYMQETDIRDYAAEIVDLSVKRKKAEQQRATILQWFTDGLLDEAASQSKLKDLAREINDINATTASLHNAAQTKKPDIDVGQILAATTFEQRRQAVLSTGLKIISKRNPDGSIWFGFN